MITGEMLRCVKKTYLLKIAVDERNDHYVIHVKQTKNDFCNGNVNAIIWGWYIKENDVIYWITINLTMATMSFDLNW